MGVSWRRWPVGGVALIALTGEGSETRTVDNGGRVAGVEWAAAGAAAAELAGLAACAWSWVVGLAILWHQRTYVRSGNFFHYGTFSPILLMQ